MIATEGFSVASDRSVLPIPERQHVGLTTYDAKDPDTSFPSIEQLRPPAGAPNVLIVLLDDVGFAASSAFGGPISTPLERTPAAGESELGAVEGPRGASWVWLRAGADGTIDRLRLRSASFANWPVVAAAAPGNLVPDFPLINKSFELCYACVDR